MSIKMYTWTYCSFCKRAKHLLDDLGLSYEEIPIDNDDQKKQELIAQTDHYTVPYVFIDGEFVGGYTELKQKMDAETR